MTARPGVVLDAGPFIQLERRNATMVRLAKLFVDERTPLVTSAAVIAQIWRGGTERQVPIAYLLRRLEVVPLAMPVAKLLGRMLGATGTADPVDAHVAFLARERGWPVLTSDPRDLRAIDSAIAIVNI